MFDPQTPPTQNPLNPTMPSPGMPPSMPGNVPPPMPSSSLPPQPQVHTMPERFRATGGAPKGGGTGSKRLVTILLILVGVAAVVVGGLWAMNSFLLKETNTNTTTNTTNTANTNDTNSAAAATRDSQRRADLSALQVALGSFYTASSAYPLTLTDLQNNTANIPVANINDPLTNQPYSYQTCTSNTHYVLSATLEVDNSTIYTADGVTQAQTTPIVCGASSTNSNTNADINSNANANTNTSTNTNTNANTNSSIGTPLPSSKDTDGDGLTDAEEAVFTTDANNPDSDGDTFIDGKQLRSDGTIVGEVYLGYNPKGAGTLEAATTVVKRAQDAANVYSVLIPTKWTASASSQGGVLVTPDTSTGEFFQVQTATNPTRLTPQQWYQQNNPSANVASLGTIAVNGLEGIVSEDGSTVYLFKDTSVYSIQYGTGSVSAVNYRTTFDMIVRNFKLVASS